MIRFVSSMLSITLLLTPITLSVENNDSTNTQYVVTTCEKDNPDLPLKPIKEPDWIIEEETVEEDLPPLEYVDIDLTNITEEEIRILACLVYLESGCCSDECKRGIVSVVLNRLYSKHWRIDVNKDNKITLYDIIYYPNAFSPASLINKTTPTESCYQAVYYVLTNGSTLPKYVRYFRIDYDFNWSNYENYSVIDNTYFGYLTNWQNGAW